MVSGMMRTGVEASAYLFAMLLAGFLAYDIRLYAIRGCELQRWPPKNRLAFFLFQYVIASADRPRMLPVAFAQMGR